MVRLECCGFELVVSEDPAINYRPGLQPTEQTTRTKRRNLEWARYTRASVLRWTDGQGGRTQFRTISRRRAGQEGIVHHGCVGYNEFQPLASLLLAGIPHPVWAVTPPRATSPPPRCNERSPTNLPTYHSSYQPTYQASSLPNYQIT